MQVVFVTDAWLPQVNGVVTTLRHVQRELHSLGHEVVVIQPQQFCTVPCPKYPEIRLSCLPGPRLRRMLRSLDADAIHIVTEGPLGLSARLFCGANDVPFTTSYHTQFPQYLASYAGVSPRISYRALRWFHGPASSTLVPTRRVQEELEAQGFDNVRLWTRGVDVDVFEPGDKAFLEDERPIFMYVGRVAREKNLEAFLGLDLPGSKYVVGGGPALAPLSAKFPDARFVGYKFGRDLARHLAAADVFVFPRRTDTFGIVMLEAMACGLPVAAYPVTGPLDVVEHGVSGILDEDLRVAAMACLDLDPAECRRYASKFSWRRCAEAMAEVLVPVADKAASAA